MRARLLIVLAALASSPALAGAKNEADHVAPSAVMPAALSLFERDWVLMNWALKFYDADGNVLLSPDEASAAADAFRKLADADGDGRITPTEFRSAREFILARY
jgi:hypothetical protein